MLKVVVTGGAGFIASHIVDALLEKGHAVRVVDNFATGRHRNLKHAQELATRGRGTLEILEADIAQAATWEKLGPADALFHFAAQTSVTYSVENPDLDFQTNILPALHLTKWFRREGVKHFLYANTAGALYGEAPVFPTPETTPLRPLAPYGATKGFTESYVSALTCALKTATVWSNDPKAPNYFSWTALRLANIYGPRQYPKGEAGVVPIFIEELVAGRAPTIFGNGENKVRDYTHVSDVCAAFMTAFERSQQGPVDDVFNVATGRAISDGEVFREVLKAVHTRGQHEPTWAKSLAVVSAHHQSVRPGEVMTSSLSADKIQKVMGWQAKIAFAEGIRDTVTTYPLD